MANEAALILRLVVVGGFIVGALLAGLGVYLVYLGSMGETEFSFFGQTFKSTNVGIGGIFIGASLIVLLVRRVLCSLDKFAERTFEYKLSDSEVAIAALKVKDKGPDLALLDITLQNKGDIDAIVHGGELIIKAIKPATLGGYSFYLPSTHQYTLAVPAATGRYPIDMSQVVPARSIDRFQLVFALGEEESKEESPWGSCSIGSIMGSDGTKMTHIDARCVLRLLLDGDKALQTKLFNFTIHAPGFGFKARKIAGATLQEKLEMLGEQDINVLESVVLNLGTIGGDSVRGALQELQGRDLTYLKDYYEREIYNKVKDPLYWDLPSPEERLDEFKHVLQNTLLNIGLESP